MGVFFYFLSKSHRLACFIVHLLYFLSPNARWVVRESCQEFLCIPEQTQNTCYHTPFSLYALPFQTPFFFYPEFPSYNCERLWHPFDLAGRRLPCQSTQKHSQLGLALNRCRITH